MELSERLHSQWVESAQDWIDTDQAVRTGMLDSWMLDALGNVGGKSAIDIGCGEGRFSRLLSQARRKCHGRGPHRGSDRKGAHYEHRRSVHAWRCRKPQ